MTISFISRLLISAIQLVVILSENYHFYLSLHLICKKTVMIKITFPDHSIREFEPGVTGLDIAKNISNSLAREVVAVSVNNEIWDASRPILTDASLVLHKFDTPEGKHAFWHSSAHLMAEALEALYPGIKFGIGPAIENGFYYDVDPGDGVVITEADLPRIEEKMVELGRKNSEYKREEIGKKDQGTKRPLYHLRLWKNGKDHRQGAQGGRGPVRRR